MAAREADTSGPDDGISAVGQTSCGRAQWPGGYHVGRWMGRRSEHGWWLLERASGATHPRPDVTTISLAPAIHGGGCYGER